MITIIIEAEELYNDETWEFMLTDRIEVELEHSLYAISKWETKMKKPFLSTELSSEDFLFYVECMVIDETKSEYVKKFSNENLLKIREYINDECTATVITENQPSKKNSRFVTSELVYYWMAGNQIPFECDKWNFNRLMTLIRICSIESQSPKKMKKSDILKSNHAKNLARRKKLGTKG